MAQPPCRSPSKVKSFFCKIVVESKSLFCVGERNKDSLTPAEFLHSQLFSPYIFILLGKSLVFGEYSVNANLNKLYKTWLVGWFKFRPILYESSFSLIFKFLHIYLWWWHHRKSIHYFVRILLPTHKHYFLKKNLQIISDFFLTWSYLWVMCQDQILFHHLEHGLAEIPENKKSWCHHWPMSVHGCHLYLLNAHIVTCMLSHSSTSLLVTSNTLTNKNSKKCLFPSL